MMWNQCKTSVFILDILNGLFVAYAAYVIASTLTQQAFPASAIWSVVTQHSWNQIYSDRQAGTSTV